MELFSEILIIANSLSLITSLTTTHSLILQVHSSFLFQCLGLCVAKLSIVFPYVFQFNSHRFQSEVMVKLLGFSNPLQVLLCHICTTVSISYVMNLLLTLTSFLQYVTQQFVKLCINDTATVTVVRCLFCYVHLNMGLQDCPV